MVSFLMFKKELLVKTFLGAVASALALAGQLYAAEPEFTGDAKTVNSVCNSKAPFLVLDFFSAQKPDYGHKTSEHFIDIDGDNILDVQHGDFIKKVAGFSGKKVIAYGLQRKTKRLDVSIINDGLSNIITLIKNKKMKPPAAILTSFSASFYFGEIHQKLGDDLSLTPANIGDKKDTVISRLKEKYGKKGSDNPDVNSFYDSYKALKTLKEMGVSVITVAGNNYSKNIVNVLALFGAVPVGALTHDGSETAPYSNQNTLTTVYKTGDFISRKVEGGIDINNDKQVDFATDELSNGKSIAAQFNGMPVNTKTIAPISKYFSLSDENMRKDSKIYGDYVHKPSNIQFRKDAAGNLIFDPAGDRDPTQEMLNTGTSFAVPDICNK